MLTLNSSKASKADDSHESQGEVVCTATDILFHLAHFELDKRLEGTHPTKTPR